MLDYYCRLAGQAVWIVGLFSGDACHSILAPVPELTYWRFLKWTSAAHKANDAYPSGAPGWSSSQFFKFGGCRNIRLYSTYFVMFSGFMSFYFMFGTFWHSPFLFLQWGIAWQLHFVFYINLMFLSFQCQSLVLYIWVEDMPNYIINIFFMTQIKIPF